MNRIWIELERPKNDAHALELCEKANIVLKRLGVTYDSFGWDEKRKQYTFGTPMGYMGLTDRGTWLNLDYCGRALAEGEH